MARKKNALEETEFTDRQLAEFKRILLSERNKLVQHLHKSSLNLETNRQAGEESADVGGVEFSRETNFTMIAGGNSRLKMINDALARIDSRTYGICADCGRMISLARIKAKPHALYCIDCKSQREERGEE